MSNATASSSSSSSSSSQSSRGPSSVSTVSGEGQYGENITYQNRLHPNLYQLLHLFNSEQYDDQLRAAGDQHNRLEPVIKSLFFLQSQCRLFEKIIDSCNLEIANQVMYTCNYRIGLEGPITIPEHCQNTLIPSPSPSSTDSDDKLMETATPVPTSMTLTASSHDSPLNPEPSKNGSCPESLPLPVPITPLPEISNLRPPPTPEVFRLLKPQFHQEVDVIPAVGGEGLSEEDKDVDEDRENQTPSNDEDPPLLNLRPPTPIPTPMTQLVNCVSALCADWNAISPAIAHSTCVADASQLNLGIHLHTALTNEGLAKLHVEGLV
ncbi:hypothetical protein Moror_2040 [Moniliophthora roreri MCA 2997]|uniref:Uncharacterized protein n=1 Tax=Moniliophthora roreri (strain MCA 2997) TaxID=1381753 RepID=V2X409_MONRO|nr:hypothetical protein Moror_2040 [Moniliophthora roreri MCA 2997]